MLEDIDGKVLSEILSKNNQLLDTYYPVISKFLTIQELKNTEIQELTQLKCCEW